MKKILVIEDNDQFRQNTIEILQLAEYNARGCADGRNAVKKAHEFLPDLILCDIDLPDLDGFGILQIIRHSTLLKNVIFILMTGIVRNQSFRNGMNLGADDFILKPFNGTDLLNMVSMRFKRLQDCFEGSKLDSSNTNGALFSNDSFHPLFSSYPPTILKRGEKIYRTAQPIVYATYLVEGFVRTSRVDRTGKELSTAIYKPGDIIGVSDIMAGTQWTGQAYTMTDILFVSVPIEELRSRLKIDNHLCNLLQAQLARQLNLSDESRFVLVFGNVRGKVGYALLYVSDQLKNTVEDNPYIRLTRHNLATFAGVAKESVIRTISDFLEERLIEESAKGIRILDRAKLERIAGRS